MRRVMRRDDRQSVSLARMLLILCALLVFGLLTSPVQAQVRTGQIFHLDGDVTVTVLPRSASFGAEIWLFSPGTPRFIANAASTGTTVTLSGLSVGAELVFGVIVSDPTFGRVTYQIGPGSRNPDGLVHADVTFQSPQQATVGFEDTFGGGDLDFDDIRFSVTGAITGLTPVAVNIDIKPGSDPNSINLGAGGVVAVAVFGSTTLSFDRATVVSTTLTLAGATAVRFSVEDVNADGLLDLVLHFNISDLRLTTSSTSATLAGEILFSDGTRVAIVGSDSVRIIGNDGR